MLEVFLFEIQSSKNSFDILEKYISFLLNFNEICKITY